MEDKQPILVTGAHRTGTTWVGKMLAASDEAVYVSEPLNVLHRPGVMRAPVDRWYLYINEENEDDYLPALLETLEFRYHLWLEIGALRSLKDLLRMVRDLGRALEGRLRNARPVLKDPFAVFSAPWFADRLGCRVVVMVRHPAAFVSSLKRLAWFFDFKDLLQQPLLMRDYLEDFQEEMERLRYGPKDMIEQGSLLWKMVYASVARYLESYPDFVMVRHEDLAREPQEGFAEIYAALGLEYSSRIQRVILNATHSGNPQEVSEQRPYAVRLDSQAILSSWRNRLTGEEVKRIHVLTADVAERYYSDQEWE